MRIGIAAVFAAIVLAAILAGARLGVIGGERSGATVVDPQLTDSAIEFRRGERFGASVVDPLLTDPAIEFRNGERSATDR